MTRTSARTSTVAAATAGNPSPRSSDELRYDWDPQLLPTELQLAPEFRSACAPIVALPPSVRLDEDEEVVDALEPIASCLTIGPLSQERLHLLGASELPRRWQAPVDGRGRADQLRSSLSLLGVPFENLVTHDVDRGRAVELAIAPGSS